MMLCWYFKTKHTLASLLSTVSASIWQSLDGMQDLTCLLNSLQTFSTCHKGPMWMHGYQLVYLIIQQGNHKTKYHKGKETKYHKGKSVHMFNFYKSHTSSKYLQYLLLTLLLMILFTTPSAATFTWNKDVLGTWEKHRTNPRTNESFFIIVCVSDR